ncbi:uncharacterized protein LOC141492632 isoform X1 [Macrotis lagotis]|uniref:uncharacterized protein LOC141492632 isoform X1 n=1 Tax=Macrotis lagotis TaxID=92651 RepID=UPI003D698F18
MNSEEQYKDHTNDEESSKLSDVITSITSLIQHLDLDKVVEISIDDLLKNTKEVSSMAAWTAVSSKTSPKPLQQDKISDLLEDGREGPGKRTPIPHLYSTKKTSSSPFYKKALQQVFPVEKSRRSSLTSFGLKLHVKPSLLDRRNCPRASHFPPLSKILAEKKSELSSKIQNQQERYTPVTIPSYRKKETDSGYMHVVNIWTISPVLKHQDHNLLPGKIFIPQKSRCSTVKKTFK